MDSEGHACPVCGQPVETVIRRHKTLGTWVPTWVGGPCRNQKCAAYAEPEGMERAEGSVVGGDDRPAADRERASGRSG
ncbi:hypothetical protein ABZX40_02485 [Streptomyces sp. NPDC004610]|uniref:hypothetical protein n=1 Tax=unclassified Streptomyces TaxID=2593676 RepID=UPI0033A9D70F